MRLPLPLPLDLVLAATCGAVSFVASELAGVHHAAREDGALRERWPAEWSASADAAAAAASERDVPVLVYARADTFACRALEEAAGEDAVLGERMDAFVPLALDLAGSGGDRALARALAIEVVPAFVLVDAGDLRTGLGDPGTRIPRTGVRAGTGGLHEPFGLAHEMSAERAAERADGAGAFDAALEEIERALGGGDAASADGVLVAMVAGGASPNDPGRRLGRFVTALRGHVVVGPADAEGTLEASLLVEGDDRVLFRGWSLLASAFELRARAADAAEDEVYRGVDATRWRRRLRDATRRAWLSCPDATVVPFGALLIERYGASERDLDSLDRRFCAAVLRTLQRTAPDAPRVERAAEIVASLR
ncbi:MAG: hypothetical protein AAF957_02560 [Planctomycetota bacterium]